MSKATATRSIKFVSKGGTYTAMLTSPTGDIVQFYDGTTIFPNFASSHPEIFFVCSSSRVAGTPTVESVRWEVNGNELSFVTSNGQVLSTGAYSGVFERITQDGKPGLRILQNIVDTLNPIPMTIRAEVGIAAGGSIELLQASYQIRVEQKSQSDYFVTLAANDAKNFTISDKGESVQLKAQVYMGGTVQSPTGFTFDFFRYGTSGWEAMPTAQVSGDVLTVLEADVDTYGDFKVEVSKEGNLIGTDIQGVIDVSDPYEIAMEADPPNETITDAMAEGAGVEYKNIRLVTRGTNVPAQGTPTFTYSVRGSANEVVGNVVTTTDNTYTVTRGQCDAAGGDVTFVVQATLS